MFNPALRLTSAVAWHQVRLLSFSHAGRGLPRLGSTFLVLLVVMKLVLSCLMVTSLLSDAGLLTSFCKSLFALAMLYYIAFVVRQAYAFSGYLLLCSGVEGGLLLLNQVVGRVPRDFMMTCYAWAFLAFIVLLLRAAAHHEKENF